MKSFKQHIYEKLKVSSPLHKYTLFPKSKDELKQMIKHEISKNGNECSLNHIDVSEITYMSYMFYDSKFNGDISKWDVSNVNNMYATFCRSIFNGDISKWNVSNVRNMSYMFNRSVFSGDISNWDISNVTDMSHMFYGSSLENNPPKWYKE